MKCKAKEVEISNSASRFAEERNALAGSLTGAEGAASAAEAERVKLSGNYAALTDKYVGLDGTVQESERQLGAIANSLKGCQANLGKARRDLNSRQTQAASL